MNSGWNGKETQDITFIVLEIELNEPSSNLGHDCLHNILEKGIDLGLAKITDQTMFISLGMVTGLGEGKIRIKINWNSIKERLGSTFYGVGAKAQ